MMKKNRIYTCVTALLLVVSTALVSGCNKFLDIQPKGTLGEDVQFKDEQGFKDALYGVYALMGQSSLYGDHLTYGFVDKLGQVFEYIDPSNIDDKILKYAYKDLTVRPIIDNIWSTQYTTIAAVNKIIEHAEHSSLEGETMNIIKGEAYALRAFLHFDLARLFCVDYAQRAGKSGIPYAYKADLENKKLFDIEGVYKNILDDLTKAEELLRGDEVLNSPLGHSKDVYRDERYSALNKYAVMALKARVYYTMGEGLKAAEYARKVIGSKGVVGDDLEGIVSLGLTKASNFVSVKDFPGRGEILFGIYASGQAQNIFARFLTNTSSGNFTEGRKDLKQLYETDQFTATSTDHRYAAYYKEVANKVSAFTRFIASEAELNQKVFTGIPLIRLPEMYYILSECLYDTDREESLKLLNAVRASRGLEAVSESKVETKDKYLSEMMRERMREMPGEGQIFFAYKHYNMPIRDLQGKKDIAPSEEIFVLPWPESEIEFGNVSKK